MNSCCTLYHLDPNDLITNKKLVTDDLGCCNTSSCYCSYVQYESLIPYFPKLMNQYTKDQDHIVIEAKLRDELISFSRLFDIQTNYNPGEHGKGHYKLMKLYGDGSNYLKIPEFIEGTLELYTSDGYLINADSYYYRDGHLLMTNCNNHGVTCGCSKTCGLYENKKYSPGWNGYFQAKARFGKDCVDPGIKLAIIACLIEWNTFGDAKETNFQGLPVSRSFKYPPIWTSTCDTYKKKKNFYNSFGFA